MQGYMLRQVREAADRARQRREQLRTKADAQAYVREARKLAQACFGPFPERTPLNARTVGTLEREGYSIEKILFESRPGLLVTGNLYLPKASGKRPAVLGLCGHSVNGKAEAAYQSFCQSLAKKGYVVFIIDPIGQGERLQYLNKEGDSEVGKGVKEHLLCGNQQFLVGEFFGSWRAWDAIRALDYLLDRPEVDAKHVGVTGNSGGGTMTTWVVALDERITMAAPSCFVTTFRHNLENELPQDTEQHPPGALARNMDHDVFLAAMAPNPLLILGQEKDFFDVRGTEEAYERLKPLYKLLGHEENLGLFVGPQTHGYKIENRQAMYAWFNKASGTNADADEPPITVEEEKDLWVTPKGQVGFEGSTPVYEFTRRRAKALAQQRRPLEGKALKQAVADALNLTALLQAGPSQPHYRILRPIKRTDGKPMAYMTPYLLEVEKEIDLPMYALMNGPHVSRPKAGRRAILYVSHLSADVELSREPLIEQLVREEPESALFACDVRGAGESCPTTAGIDPHAPYGADYFYAIHSIMLNRPYVGQKTYDLVRAMDWLKGVGFEEIHVAALGWGTLAATFAGVLHDGVAQVTLKGAPESYGRIAETERYDWPLSCFVPGVLKHFDLPDCYFHGLKDKHLRRI